MIKRTKEVQQLEKSPDVDSHRKAPDVDSHRKAPSDWQISLVLASCFGFVALAMLLGWGWGVPAWQDLPSVRLDVALHGSEAALAVRAEALEASAVTNQVRIFHETNEQQLIEEYPLSSTLTLETLTVIPGLANTLSWNALYESPTVSQHMVPQGIAVSDKNIFISAYDGARSANSVIYQIDRSTGALQKTIVLTGQPHVGGLAFDRDHNRLWVCSRRGNRAQLVAIDLVRIDSYDNEQAEPIRYDATALVIGPKRASFVEYFDGSLYVGFFNATDTGMLYRYLLDEDGDLSRESAQTPAESWELPPCAQGVALTDTQVLVSVSHGKQNSTLWVFERDTVFDYVASLPLHGGRPIYGVAPEDVSQAADGSGSAQGDDPGEHQNEALFGDLPSMEEVLQFLFGAPDTSTDLQVSTEGQNSSFDEHLAQDDGQGSAATTLSWHAPVFEGMALMAADRAQIHGEMAAGMSAQAEALARSGEYAEREVISYAKDPVAVVELPPMLEDLTIYEGNLYAVHESGAAVYRNRYGVGIDRVVTYPLALFEVPVTQDALQHADNTSTEEV